MLFKWTVFSLRIERHFSALRVRKPSQRLYTSETTIVVEKWLSRVDYPISYAYPSNGLKTNEFWCVELGSRHSLIYALICPVLTRSKYSETINNCNEFVRISGIGVFIYINYLLIFHFHILICYNEDKYYVHNNLSDCLMFHAIFVFQLK